MHMGISKLLDLPGALEAPLDLKRGGGGAGARIGRAAAPSDLRSLHPCPSRSGR